MKTYVLFHASCPDGFGSAWAHYQLTGGVNTEYIPVSYNEAPPTMPAGSPVFIIDFSYPRDVLLELRGKHPALVLLDHHTSAKDILKGLDFAKFDMHKSGAMMAFEYFHPHKNVPLMIKYVMDRDLWTFTLPYSREIHAYMSAFAREFRVWDQLQEDIEKRFEEVVRVGKILLQNDEIRVKEISQQTRMINFENYQIPCVNSPTLISEIGHTLLNDYPDAPFSMSFFVSKKGEVSCSLRSRGDFDVSTLAQKFGGGGHIAAAGCRLDRIP